MRTVFCLFASSAETPSIRSPIPFFVTKLPARAPSSCHLLMDGWQPFRRGFFSTQFGAIVTNETLLRVAEYTRTIDTIQGK